MPLDAEFKKHLPSLMVEVDEKPLMTVLTGCVWIV